MTARADKGKLTNPINMFVRKTNLNKPVKISKTAVIPEETVLGEMLRSQLNTEDRYCIYVNEER